MITVHNSATNYFRIHGEGLKDLHTQMSTISIHESGFTIELHTQKTGAFVMNDLSREQVLPKLKEMLENAHVKSDVDEGDINKHLDSLTRFAQKNFKVAPMFKRWAICNVYEPFRLGGSLWTWHRYEVDAIDVDLAKDFKGFCFYDDVCLNHKVQEEETGAFLGEGVTKQDAINDANKNIEDTPDLRSQIVEFTEKYGKRELMTIIEKADALRKIAKGK